MFQKISKMLDNLMFSYITFKLVKDKMVYTLKLNFITIGIFISLLIITFSITSYSFIVHPLFKDRYEHAKTRYITQTSLMADYDKEMLEKKRLIKSINKRFVDAFEESEIDENVSENLDKCRNADCMMWTVINTVPDSRLRATFSIPQGMPAQGWFMSGYGMRPDPFTGKMSMHYGIDISNGLGTPIKSTMTGTVVFSGYAGYDTLYGGYGNVVVISNGFYKTLYAHLLYAKAKYGQTVRRGDVVGYMGNTGYSKGVHLHYSVITYDYIDSLEFTK
jgi:murein DD-endopeptidase MepM/ murein hydrolase activator NlpD